MIYRRRITGAILERIEIVPRSQSPDPASCNELLNSPIKVVMERVEGETQVYNVQLPDSFMVKPPDWRRLSYDHAEVEKRIGLCVKDNTQGYLFEPLSESLYGMLEHELNIALADLSSLIDRVQVKCGALHGDVAEPGISVDFDFRNGETKVLYFPLQALFCN